MAIRLDDRRLSLEPIAEFFIGTPPVARSCAIEGEAVFVEYGPDAPEHGVDELGTRDLNWKITVVMSGTQTGLTPAIAAHLEAGKLGRLSRTGAIRYLRVDT